MQLFHKKITDVRLKSSWEHLVTDHGIAILYGLWAMGQTGYVTHAVC